MIDTFSGEYSFLSNFFIESDGTCVEVEFQRAKCDDPQDKDLFLGVTPGQSKRIGRKIKLRPDWEEVKLDVMESLLRLKFDDHKDLSQKLLDTGTQDLVEGNVWGDFYWGACAGVGQNQLGKLLMKIRRDLFVMRTIDYLCMRSN
jgi:ribA/ribD-fused uncharacterized protein